MCLKFVCIAGKCESPSLDDGGGRLPPRGGGGRKYKYYDGSDDGPSGGWRGNRGNWSGDLFFKAVRVFLSLFRDRKEEKRRIKEEEETRKVDKWSM